MDKNSMTEADFWDFSSTLPPKLNNAGDLKERVPVATFAVEFDDNSASGKGGIPISSINKSRAEKLKVLLAPGDLSNSPDFLGLEKEKQEPETYEFERDIFISCRIEPIKRGESLFAQFLRDAQEYYRKTCLSANYVYFFSYRPMYSQLSREQLCWYLFWRSKVRKGEYPKTGLSYIFLYLYELINLTEVLGADKTYPPFVAVWKNYREEFPRMDKYAAEWLTDFSLIHRKKIDLAEISDFLPKILNIASIPEMFLVDGFFQKSEYYGLIFENISLYNYKKSKYYANERVEIFDTHMKGLLSAALNSGEFRGIYAFEAESGVKVKNIRESFSGAVCSQSAMKKITLEYRNIYRNNMLRQLITEIIRRAENLVREFLGVKSKLATGQIPQEIAEAMDSYAARFLPAPARKTKQREKIPPGEEESPPAPAEFNPDIKSAADIEQASWETTAALVELQERDGEYRDEPVLPPPAAESDPGGFGEITSFGELLTEREREILALLVGCRGEAQFSALSGRVFADCGIMLESAVDSINEKAMESLGDIIFDPAEKVLIEEYAEEAENAVGNQ